jgi:hypothetical protein
MDARRHQRELLRCIAGDDLKPLPLPRWYCLDWAIVAENRIVKAWVECLTLEGAKGANDHVEVDYKKWSEGTTFARNGAPFIIAAEWEDGLFYARHDEVAPYAVAGVGRRAPSKDVPCIQLPTALFKPADDLHRQTEPLTESC